MVLGSKVPLAWSGIAQGPLNVRLKGPNIHSFDHFLHAQTTRSSPAHFIQCSIFAFGRSVVGFRYKCHALLYVLSV